jgi:hypothetical protein
MDLGEVLLVTVAGIVVAAALCWAIVAFAVRHQHTPHGGAPRESNRRDRR